MLRLTEGIVVSVVATGLAGRYCLTFGKLTPAAGSNVSRGGEPAGDRKDGENERREGDHGDDA